MIFNKDFDKVLWLMIASNRKNKYNIVKLVNMIPNYLFEEIRNLLDCKSLLEVKRIRKGIRDSFGNTYFFDIYVSNEEIKIELSKFGLSNDCEESYVLDLKTISLDQELVIDSIDSIDSIDIGSFFERSVDVYHMLGKAVVLTKCNMSFYEILDITNNKIIIQLLDDIHYCKEIPLEKIPDEINLKDMVDNRSVNKLVRGKKKKRL